MLESFLLSIAGHLTPCVIDFWSILVCNCLWAKELLSQYESLKVFIGTVV